MFETLRKLIFPIIIVVLLFFVAMIILEWGLNFTGRGKYTTVSYAAKINGEEIPFDYYQRIYNNMYQAESQQAEGEVTEERSRQLETEAWNQLLQDRLLQQQAKKHNIVVTDEDIFFYLRNNPPEYVRQQPSFQTNGQFDYQKYVQAMVDPQNAPFWTAVETNVRADLTKMKMQQLVIDAVTVTDPEVQQAELDQLEQVRVNAINATWTKYYATAQQPTADEVASYFESHKEDYKQPERAIFNIVFLQKQPSDLDRESARQQIAAIYDSVKAGADFAEMARSYSSDGSASQGGDLGWLSAGQTIKEFDTHAFSMKSGEISEPFLTQFGWHIIKHEGYRDTTMAVEANKAPEKVRQAKVAHILIKVESSQATLDGIFQKLQEFQTEAPKTGFEAAAKELGLTVQKTPPFAKGGPIQTLGNLPSAHDFAFSAKPGEISQVFDLSSGYAVAQLDKRLEAGLPTLDDVRDRVKNDALRVQVAKICDDVMASVYKAMKSGVPAEQAAKSQGLTYDTIPAFSRTGFIPGLGRPSRAIGEAFSLKKPGEFTPPVNHDVGTIIFVLRERISPDLTQLNDKRDSVYNSVLYAKQQEVYTRWFENLIKNSNIENNIEQLNRGTVTTQ